MENKLCPVQNSPPEGRVLALPCHKLVEHPLRLAFYSQNHLAGLSESIKANGLLEPILVQPLEDGQYLILNGHYRVRAVRRLKQKEILCRVYPCDRRTALVIFCTSSLLTKSLSPLEEALMMSGLIKEAGFNQAQVGRLWGHSKSWVSRRLKLLTALDPQVKRELDEGNLRPRLAQELARLPQGNGQTRVLALIRRYQLTKDQAARLIDRWQRASEERRCQLEEKGGFPLPPLAELSPVKDPGRYATELLGRCTLALDELTGFLRQQKPPFKWWPQSHYRSFLRTVAAMADFVPEGLTGG